MANSKFKFAEGEKVLCYEPDPNKAKVLYDSKIRDFRINNKKTEYLIHFQKWASKYDSWVPEESILPDTSENRALQKNLATQALAAQQIKTKSSRSRHRIHRIPAALREQLGGNSRDNFLTDERSQDTMGSDFEAGYDSEMDRFSEAGSIASDVSEVSASSNRSRGSRSKAPPLPDFPLLSVELKTILDQDYREIVVNNVQYDLPFKVTVRQILGDFKRVIDERNYYEWIHNYQPPKLPSLARAVNTCPEPFPEMPLLIEEFINSTIIYFDTIFLTHLCYHDEEKVHFANCGQKSAPSNTYGLIHLLRLLVVLPDFLTASTSFPRKDLEILVKMLDSFILYLTRNYSKYLS